MDHGVPIEILAKAGGSGLRSRQNPFDFGRGVRPEEQRGHRAENEHDPRQKRERQQWRRDHAEIAMVPQDGWAGHAGGPDPEHEGLARPPPENAARYYEEQAGDSGQAGNGLAGAAGEQVMMQVEQPEFRPLPLAVPLADRGAGQVHIGSAPLCPDQPVKTQIARGEDHRFRARAGTFHDPLGDAGDRGGILNLRIIRVGGA